MVEIETTATELHWQSFGEGKDLVLLHGWGMNGAVWQQTAQRLSQHFRVHIVDLPGFGHSHQASFSSLADLTQQVLDEAPAQAVWLGWSLGGLVASHIALHHPERISALITVASSPCFAEQKPWRGIQAKVLKAFTAQLIDDFQLTIERFIALQAMGSPSARQDLKALKQAVLSRPMPNQQALLAGLNLLGEVDYRQRLHQVEIPTLRLYGRLDGLVPIQVAEDVAALMPNSQSYVFSQSSHAPFMTEFEEFCQQVTHFCHLTR
ncbi:pimeloyl-[acyl-carrier protein] methyl ester esterase [Vibrio panuliri]|uniref:Pimeloyl-[acyl-carrier protein] methyl ester esterase n=1 Tax=Vibrio panuliri TaxID=1381081 RepID=A0A1Q9HAC4_9VIBR|nr:pimeloyl-ACP methyl ester esterase BioH [Vibrio panuliri]OLQ86082.1 pimeloyl-[acyl-carrier protein] methyl ester esterase [Vibrio panuliri]